MTCCFNVPETPQQTVDEVPYTLYSDDGVYMVKVINVCDWLDHTYGEDWDKHPYYETSGKDLMAWCEKNNSYYYARGREDFFCRGGRSTVHRGRPRHSSCRRPIVKEKK